MVDAAKLIRDKIPDLMRDQGLVPQVRVADEVEYSFRLRTKLLEEVGEFLASGDLNEIVDVLEVCLSIARDVGISGNELERLRRCKAAERGGFADRLIWVEPRSVANPANHDAGTSLRRA